jgi:hypothetical protein
MFRTRRSCLWLGVIEAAIGIDGKDTEFFFKKDGEKGG